MANVHGKKIFEPRLSSRSGQPHDASALRTGGLEKAWTHLAEAKSIFERLESRRKREEDSAPRRTRRVVTFTSRDEERPSSRSARLTNRKHGHRDLEVEDLEQREHDGEHMVDPSPLNEHLSRPDHEEKLHDERYKPRFARSTDFQSDDKLASATSYRASPISAGSEYHSGRRERYLRETERSPSPQYRHSSTSGVGDTLPHSAGLRSSHAPSTGKLSSSYSYKSKTVAWNDDVVGHDKEAEPSSGALREAMDEQRRSVSMATDRMNRLRSKPGYYPLSEASSNTTPLHSAEPTPRHSRLYPSSSSGASAGISAGRYTRHAYSTEPSGDSYSITRTSEAPPTKRKVAAAPPVGSSYGFHLLESDSAPSKTRFRSDYRSQAVSSVAPSLSDERSASGSGRGTFSTSKPRSLERSSIYSSYYDPPVRKVHHMSTAPTGSDGGVGATRVTNSASWRIGRSIAAEVRRKEAEKLKEGDKEDDLCSDDHSPLSGLSHASGARPEIKVSPPTADPPRSGEHSGRLSYGSESGIPASHSPGSALDQGRQPADDEVETLTGSSSASSVLDARVDKLSLDMKQLRDELRTTPTATPTRRGVSKSGGRAEDESGAGIGKRGQQGEIGMEDARGGGGLSDRGTSYDRPWRTNMRGRPSVSKSDEANKKPKLTSDQRFPAEKVRHYDQAAVQAYIQRKSEERRRKAQEERAQLSQAAREKEEKLNKLFEEQRESVERNLRHQQRMRELREGRRPTRSSGGVHIHIEDGSDSECDATLTTHKYLSSSWRSPMRSDHTHYRAGGSSADRRPLMSALDRSPAATSSHLPRTSPPRYGSFHATSSATPTFSGSRVHSTSYTSPLKTAPYSRDSLYQKGVSPRERVSSPSIPRSRDEAVPTVTGYARFEFAQSRTTQPSSSVYSPASPGRVSASSSAGVSPQDRLQAITVAAQELKERILEQTRRVESQVGKDTDMTSRRSRVSWRGKRARDEDELGQPGHTNARVLFPGKVPADSTGASFKSSTGNLPGVSRLQDHASRAAQTRRENDAARIIQAAYRGHLVRKSRSWAMPSGGTLRDSLRGERPKGGDGREIADDEKGVVSDDGTLTPPTDHSGEGGASKTSPLPTTTMVGSVSLDGQVGKGLPQISGSPRLETVLPSVPAEPWRQGGGDAHSVVNIFARQNQQQHTYFGTQSPVVGVISQSPAHQVPSVTVVSAALPQSSLSLATPPVTSSVMASTPALLNNSHLCVPLVTSPVKLNTSVGGAEGGVSFDQSSEKDSFGLERKYWEPSRNRSFSFSSAFSMSSRATSSPTPSVATPPQPTSGSTVHRSSSGTDLKLNESHLPKSFPTTVKEEEKEGSSSGAISPLDSSSLVDSYSSLNVPRLVSPLPTVSGGKKGGVETTCVGTGTPASAASTVPEGRFSPRSLDLRLQAELNHLDVVTSTIGHVSEMERTRAVSLAQQETVNVARLLQSQEENHRREVQEAAVKSELEKMTWEGVEEDRRKRLEKINKDVRDEVERMKKMQRKQDELSVRLTEQDQKFTAALDDNSKRMADMLKKKEAEPSGLADNSGVFSGQPGEPKVPVGVVRDIAESAASAAAREAVAGALKVVTPLQASTDGPHLGSQRLTVTKPKTPPPETSVSHGYEEDFEPVTSTPSKVVTETSEVSVTIPTETSKEKDSSSVVKDPSDVEEELEEDIESSGGEESDSEVTEDSEETLSAEESTVEEEVKEEHDGRSSLSRSEEVAEVLESSGGPTTTSQEKSEILRDVIPSEMQRRHHYSLSKTSSAATSDNEESLFSPTPSVRSESRATTPGLSEVGSTLSPGNMGGEESFFGFMSRMVKVYMQEEEVRAKHQEALLELREKAIRDKAKVELEWLKLREREIKSKGGDEQMPPLKKRERGLLRKLEREKAEIQTLKSVQAAARQERKMMLIQHDEISRMRQSTQYYRQKISKYRRRAREATPSREDVGGARAESQSGMISDRESSVLSDSFDDTLGASPMKVSHSSAITEMLESAGKSQSTEKATPTISVAMSGSVSHLTVPSESLSSKTIRDNGLSSGRKPAARADPNQQKKLAELGERLARLTSTETTSTDVVEVKSSTSAIPEVLSNDTGATLSSTMPSEYLQDSFESPELTTSRVTKTELSQPGGVATSTPMTTASGRIQPSVVESGSVRGQLQGDEDVTLSEPVSDAVTMTSDGSEIEARIRLLQKQLQEKQVEMKKMANVKAKRRKELLRKKEEELKERLLAAETRLKLEKSSMIKESSYTPPPEEYSSEDNTLSPSRRVSDHLSEIEEEEKDQRDQKVDSSPLIASPLATHNRPSVSDVPSYSMVFTGESTLNRESVAEELSQPLPHSESVSPISTLSSEPQFKTSSHDHPEEMDFNETLTENRLRTALRAENNQEEGPEGSNVRDQVEGSGLFSSIEEDIPENDLSAEFGSDLGEGIDDYATQQDPQFQQEVDLVKKESRGERESELEESLELQEDEVEGFENEEMLQLQDDEGERYENEDSFEFQDGERDLLENEDSFELEQEELDRIPEVEEVPDIQVGEEVIVSGTEVGIVRFVGRTHFAEGYWIGIEIPEPKGLNDGSIEGRRYFDAPFKCGVFAPPFRVVRKTDEATRQMLERKAQEEAQEAAKQEKAQGSVDNHLEELDEDIGEEAEVSEDEVKYDDENQELVHKESEEEVKKEKEEMTEVVKANVEDAEDKEITEEIEEEVDDLEDSLQEDATGEQFDQEEKLGLEKTNLEDQIDDGVEPGSNQTLVPSVGHVTVDNRSTEGELREDEHQEEEYQEKFKHPEVVEPEQQQVETQPQQVDQTELNVLKKATLEKKADIVTDQLLSLLLNSEFNLAYDIRASRRVSAAAEETVEDEAVVEISKDDSPPGDPTITALAEDPLPLSQSGQNGRRPAEVMTSVPTLPNLPPPPPITPETFPYENGLLPAETYNRIEATDAQFKSDLKSKITHSSSSDTTNAGSPCVSPSSSSQTVPADVLPVASNDILKRPAAAMTSTPTLPNLPPPPPITAETFPFENGLLPAETYDRIKVVDAQFVADFKSKASTFSGSPSPPLSPTSSNVQRPFHPAVARENLPGSSPSPLSESTVARLVAGEKSPPPTSPPPQGGASSTAASKLERTTSVDSLANMLASIKVTSAQCMVPSKREVVDNIVAYAWEEATRIGFDNVESLKKTNKHLSPKEMLKNARKATRKPGEESDFDDDEDDLGPTEVECREAYVELVFQLALEIIETLHPKKEETPVWTTESATRVLLVPHLFPNYDRPTVYDVQKRVYASLMRGQVPEKLPSLKFLHKDKRPGRKAIDTVDRMLIQELRREEPEWVDYCRDEQDVKVQVADAIMESLLVETAKVTRDIMEKKAKDAVCNGVL